MFFPKMPIGIFYGFDKNVKGDVYYILSTTKEIARIDAKMDDGKPGAGSNVRTEECQILEVDGINEYDLSANDDLCGSWIASEAWFPIGWPSW